MPRLFSDCNYTSTDVKVHTHNSSYKHASWRTQSKGT